MELDRIGELLTLLREHNVTQFSCPEFSLSIAPGTPKVQPLEDAIEDTREATREAVRAARDPKIAARGVYGSSSLWPSGVAPSFPGSEG